MRHATRTPTPGRPRKTRQQMLALGRRVEALDPWRGECGLCGGPDARHRLWDSLRTPETPQKNAHWMGVGVALVRLVRAHTDRTLVAASRAVRAERAARSRAKGAST